jgi:hypothetical protein
MVSSSKHSKANKLRATIVVVAAALFGSYSCANQASCDPGWEVEGSSCVRTTVPVDEPEGEGGAAGAAAQDPVCDPSAPPEGSFGAPCQDGVNHTDCACPAPVCAIQPGSTEGFCTQIDCVNDPSVCPSGWTCFDLSAIDPSYPPICVAQ